MIFFLFLSMEIIGRLLFSSAWGFGLAFFYYIIINALLGKKIKYYWFGIVISLFVFGASLIKDDYGMYAIFFSMIGVFVVVIGLMVYSFSAQINTAFGDKSKNKKQSIDPVNKVKPAIIYGFWFHIALIVLLAVSMFRTTESNFLKENDIEELMMMGYLQIRLSIMFVLLGIFSPFEGISVNTKSKFADQFKEKHAHKMKVFDFVANNRNQRIFRSLICAAIVAFFLGNGFFKLPWGTGSTSVILYGVSLLIFCVTNFYQLIFNPNEFMDKNLLRVRVMLTSAFSGIFVAAILVITTLVVSSMLEIDINDLQVSSVGILFLGFNVVMAITEYKVNR